MHPTLADFPNEFMYGGQLQNGPVSSAMDIDPTFAERFEDWAKQLSNDTVLPEDFPRLVGLNVVNSEVKFGKAGMCTVCCL